MRPGDQPRPRVPAEAHAAGESLLDELLRDVPPDLHGGEDRLERFEGAMELLTAVGAVDAAAWDDRMRRRLGWPTAEDERARDRAANAGGTEVDLVAVLRGPGERRAGHQVVAALRFADGISFLIDKDPVAAPEIEWPEWPARAAARSECMENRPSNRSTLARHELPGRVPARTSTRLGSGPVAAE